MNFFEWMEAMNVADIGITESERVRRLEVRERVLKKAGTSINSLRVSKCRGSIGKKLLARMILATADETEKIL